MVLHSVERTQSRTGRVMRVQTKKNLYHCQIPFLATLPQYSWHNCLWQKQKQKRGYKNRLILSLRLHHEKLQDGGKQPRETTN